MQETSHTPHLFLTCVARAVGASESLPPRNQVLTPHATRRASTREMTVRPISGWLDWYRCALDTLGFRHNEAVSYAKPCYVEEANRAILGCASSISRRAHSCCRRRARRLRRRLRSTLWRRLGRRKRARCERAALTRLLLAHRRHARTSQVGRRGLETANEAAGLPHLRWHDLRHVCASLINEPGVSVVYLAPGRAREPVDHGRRRIATATHPPPRSARGVAAAPRSRRGRAAARTFAGRSQRHGS